MDKIKVANIKCGGCAKTIQNSLKKAGFSEISINIQDQEVSFRGEDKARALRILSGLGYPQTTTAEAGSLLKKARSYFSCAIGKLPKTRR